MDTSQLPIKPGCYIYKNEKGKVIYIGKAKNIKKRVSSYFQKKELDIKTQQLVKNIKTIDFITTDNEIEALLLENTLIKKHRPKYNIDLKDSKRYAYIEITDELYPRLITSRVKKNNGKYFGPFVSGYERKYILDLLIKTFRIRTCRKLPKKACLKFHINLCDAPCINNISKEDYIDQIKKVELVLKSKTSTLVSNLKNEMILRSKNQEYEASLKIRNQLSALEYLKEKQNVQRNKKYDEDIINYVVKDNRVYLMLFKIYKGTLTNKEEFIFDYYADFFEDFMTQYYSEHDIPKEIILENEVSSSIVDYLNLINKKIVKLVIPKIGEKKILLELVKKNIELSFFGDIKKIEYLKKSLRLTFLPNVIECFDISHLSGTLTVGSMVQFRNGKADKSNYRRFRITSYLGNDDFAGMLEVVKRRYKRLKEENLDFPDLILIDGGKGQLSSALKSLNSLELNIPIIAIAKGEEEIFIPGEDESIRLPQKDKALLFLRQIRDEAHRFSINYNKLLRKKEIKD